jgi:iron complex outermembrane receptor protein
MTTLGISKSAHLRRTLLASVAISVIFANAAHAQTAPVPGAAPTPAVNDVIVTGTRQSGQKAKNSPTPIVVISGAALQQTGQVDLRAALEQLSPDITQPVYVPNGGGFKDTLTIDGLNPDQVLVLVNGKRRHSSANIGASAGPQQGVTGVDLDMIPVSAIDHIEILKAGDSAQYGSDAIAGVINIILKSASQGGSLSTTEGQYETKGGFSRDLAENVGTSLGQNGFLNISGEYSGHDHTNNRFYNPLDKLADDRDYNAFSTNREDLSVNGGYYFSDDLEFYGFATYAHRDGGQFELPRNGTVLPTIYPNGFTPQQSIAEDDYSITGGVKGKNFLGWDWDLSSTYGSDFDDIGIFESANTGLYKATGYTPTSFHLYNLTSTELTNNLDFTRPIFVAILPAPLNISFGGEQRHEGYDIGAGDYDSYVDGGSQAAPGLAPASAGNHGRDVFGTYLDLATKITPQWQVDAAGRFEHYTDAGNTTNAKLSTRYDLSPQIAFRASFGTGFDAPSLAQEFLTTVAVGPTSASGLLAANSAAAQSLGASRLRPEQSTNFNIGTVLNPIPNANVTIDAYQIDVRDRIVAGGTASGAAALAALSQIGFSLGGLSGNQVTASYFTNGAATRTRGVDIIGNYLQDFADYGSVKWELSGNINDTELLSVVKLSNGTPSLNAQQEHWLTTAAPKFKFTAGGNWQGEKWGLSLHENLYGPTSDELTNYSPAGKVLSTTVFGRFNEGIKYTTDVAIHYKLARNLQLSLGANNLFDAYPDKIPVGNQYEGLKYDIQSSQIGILGGFYYLNLSYKF